MNPNVRVNLDVIRPNILPNCKIQSQNSERFLLILKKRKKKKNFQE